MPRRKDFSADFDRLIAQFRADQVTLQARDDAANEADVRESYVFELLGLLGYPTRSPVSFRRERGLARRRSGPSSTDRPDAVLLDRRSRPLLAVDTKKYQAVDNNLVLTQKQREDPATKYLSRRQMELEKLRYCVGPGRPRFLLYTDFERLYVFDGNLPQANEHPVLAYDALDEQLAASDDLFDILNYRAVCGGSLSPRGSDHPSAP